MKERVQSGRTRVVGVLSVMTSRGRWAAKLCFALLLLLAPSASLWADSITGHVYADLNHTGAYSSSYSWRSPVSSVVANTMYVYLYSSAGVLLQSTLVSSSTAGGAYTFNGVAANSNYTVVVSASSTPSLTPTTPAGWLPMENSEGVVATTNGGVVNFGFFPGFTYSGRLFLDNGVGGGVAGNGVKDGSEQAMPGIVMTATASGSLASTSDSETTDANGAFTFWFQGAATSLRISCNGFTLASAYVGNNFNLSRYSCPIGYAGAVGGSSGGSFSGSSATIGGTSASLNYGAIAAGQQVTGAYIAMQGGPTISGRFFITGVGSESDYNSSADSTPTVSYLQNITYYFNNGATSTGVVYSSATDGTYKFTMPSGAYKARMIFPISQLADPVTGAAKYRVVILPNPQGDCDSFTYPNVPVGVNCIGDESKIPNTGYGEADGLSWWFNTIRTTNVQNGDVSGQNIGMVPLNTVTSLPAAPSVNDTSTYVYYGYKIVANSVGRIFLRASGGNSPEVYWADCASSLTWKSTLTYADVPKHGGGDITVNTPGSAYCAIVRDTIATSTTQPILMSAYYNFTSAKNNPWVTDTYTSSALSGGTIISGKVFLDNGAGSGVSGNGVQDGGELGVSGVAMQAAYTYSGKSYTTTATTDAGGNYSLSLPLGSGNVVVTRVASSAYSGSGGNAPAGWSYALGAGGAGDVFSYTAAVNLPNPTVSGVNFGVQPNVSVAGTVFYDSGYSGGSGRSLAASGGAGVSGAVVELWRLSSGTTYYYVRSTTTDANGAYKFSSLASGATYLTRVVSSSVAPSSGLLGVQSFRTNQLAADTERVGGEVPGSADYGAVSSTSYYLDAATAYINGSFSSIAQNIAPVGVVTAPVTGVDFGFIFNAIVNYNDSGQGSLRQFINNANILGSQTSQFMISDGRPHAGLRNGLAVQTNLGVAIITLRSALPTITASGVVLDGSTEAANVTSLSTSVLSGVSAGLSGSIASFNEPAVELGGAQYVLAATGASTTINALALNGVSISVGGASSTVSNNLVGMKASGAVSTQVNNVGIAIGSGSGVTVSHNYVRVNNSAIRRSGSGSSLTIRQNYIDSPGSQGSTYDGILLVGPGSMSGDVISQNYVTNMVGGGIEVGFNATASTVSGLLIDSNTTTFNGWSSPDHSSASPESVNIALWSVASGSSVTISNNLVTHSGGVGILLRSAYGVKITQNSISLNGVVSSGYTGPGIALDSSNSDPNGGATPTPMLNTGAVNSSLPNSGVNYPIFTKSTFDPTAKTIHLKGYIGSTAAARVFAGAVIELFRAASDGNQTAPTYSGSSVSAQRGEGATYLGSITADATGAFDVTLANPGFASGDLITATAYLSAYGTSEFSPDSTIVAATTVSGSVYVDVNHNGSLDSGESWSSTTSLSSTYYVNLLSGSTVIGSAAVAPGASGAYAIQDVPAGSYSLIVASAATSATVASPTGYVPTAPGNETYSVTVAATPAAIVGRNFGFYSGVSISGAVFIDDGSASGAAGDGVQNGGEAGYTAASLSIGLRYTNSSGVITNTTVATNAADGSFVAYLPSAATNVVLTRPFIAGYRSTSATATPAGSYASGYGSAADSYSFASLGVGSAVAGPYFGVMAGYVITGSVFVDNGAGSGVADNGVKDGAEGFYVSASPAQTMQASYVVGGANASTSATVDATGVFRLNLPVGATSVVVTRQALSGYIGTGGSTPVGSYSVGALPDSGDAITLGAVNASISNILCGVVAYSTISGQIFVDNGAGAGGVAADGVRNGSEAGYATSLTIGVSYKPSGASSARTASVASSASDGVFIIYVPGPVTSLVLTRPAVAGYIGTGGAVSGATGTYASGGYGAADTLTIASLNAGSSVVGPYFGVVGGVVISGSVFVDDGAGSGVADNGVKDGSEAFYTGAAQQIQLVYTPVGGAAATLTQTTSTAGAFSFVIPSGSTLVTVTRSVLSGYMGTGGVYGPSATKFAASGSPTLGDALSLGVASTPISVQYGVVAYSTITGQVFVDNGAGSGVADDGVKNGAEAGYAANLTIGVSYKPNGAGAATTSSVATSSSDGGFTIYVPGPVTSLTLTRPAVPGYLGSGGYVSSGATGSYATGGYGAADTLTIASLNAGSTVVGPYFGIVARTVVSGYVFIDNGAGSGVANNGVKDGSEAGSNLASPLTVSYTLQGASAATQSVAVASDGSYSFYLNGPATAVVITRPAVAGYVGTGFSQSGSSFGNYTRGGAGAADSISLLATLPAGAVLSGLNLGMVALNTLTAGSTQLGVAGGTLYFAHQFVANSAGAISFSTSGLSSGWSAVIYRDTTNPTTCSSTYVAANFAPLTGPLSLSTGDSVCLLAAISSPSGAVASDSVTITATANYANASPSLILSLPTAVDVYSAGVAKLKVDKVADKSVVLPSQTVTYTITVTNNGSFDANTVVVSDGTPNYTTFVSAACPASLPAGVTSCAVSSAPAVGATGSVNWSLGGTLKMGSSLSVTLVVMVD